MFSAKARKTAPEAGALPNLLITIQTRPRRQLISSNGLPNIIVIKHHSA
jgi:hypothetical protein